MIKRARANWIMILFGMTIGSTISTCVMWPRPESFEILKSETPDPVVTGDRLPVAYHGIWREKCPTEVDIFLMKDDADHEYQIVHRNGPIRAAFDSGDQKWTRSVAVPPHIANGYYIYRARFTAFCPSGTVAVAVPDMKFEVRR